MLQGRGARWLRATAAGLLILAPAGAVAATEAPPPPAAAQIKDCIKQMDAGNRWRFTWKTLEIGAPRHPRNDYEALYGLQAEAYGYPVHVVYSLEGLAEVDALYWLIRDGSGHWQIPAICRIP